MYLNRKEFEYNNIIEWHQKGYTGKGIKVANMEGGNHKAWNLKGKVFDPFDISRHPSTNNHGDKVMDILLQVAPDATIYMLPNGGYDVEGGGYGGRIVEESLPYIEENNIHLVNASLTGTNSMNLAQKIEKTKEKGTIFVTAVGNESKYDSIGYSSKNSWITISASHLSNGRAEIASYSSRGKSIDFTQFSGLYVHSQKDRNYTIKEIGTSFASPMFCGMLALVQDFFLSNTGQTLNQDQMYRFVLDNAIDLGDEGKDELYGHGIFVLPNPDEIEIEKYIKLEPNKNGDDDVDYKDVDKNRWSARNIEKVSNIGIMKGYPDGTFRPEKEVTREELATVVANLIEVMK